MSFEGTLKGAVFLLFVQEFLLPFLNPSQLVILDNASAHYNPQALELIQQVVRTRENLLGPEHPDTLLAMNNLAFSYASVGRWNEAIKLYEELLIGDNPKPTVHPRIMKAHEQFLSWAALERKLHALGAAISTNDVPLIRGMLQQLVTDYKPSGEVVDWVHLEQEKRVSA